MLFKTSRLQIAGMCALMLIGAAQAIAGEAFAPEVLGALVINASNLSTIYQGFKTAFKGAFGKVTPDWNKIATLTPSTTKTENYGWIGSWPQLREWIGDRQVKSLQAFGYSIVNKKFEASVGVPRDDIEDDTYGVFSMQFEEMGYAAATHPDALVFPALAAGNTSFCYDGQYFFDTDHPVGSGTVSKWGGGAGTAWYLLETRRPLKPLIFQKRRDYDMKAMTAGDDEAVFMRDEYRYGVDARCNVGYGLWQMAYGSKQTLDEAGFEASCIALATMKDDEGRPLGIKGNLLVVPPSLELKALKLVKSEKLASGADNPYYGRAEVLVSPYL
jgi:phage major head subunit gpT-like protein